MLSKILNYTFKTKIEDNYICARVDLFDQYYCLKLNQQLSESYLEIGLQQHLWPVSSTYIEMLFQSMLFLFFFLFKTKESITYYG